MPYCTGQGDQGDDPFNGGCCLVRNEICPHRWFIDYTGLDPATQTREATILDASGASLGTVDAYVSSVHRGKPRQDRVVDAIQGSVYVCGVLANTVVANGIPTGANWEAEFDAAWSAEYEPGASAADVGDAWAEIGKPRNWCVSFGPPDIPVCCFAQSDTECDAQAVVLTTTRVTVAQRSTLGA